MLHVCHTCVYVQSHPQNTTTCVPHLGSVASHECARVPTAVKVRNWGSLEDRPFLRRHAVLVHVKKTKLVLYFMRTIWASC